MTEKIIKEIAKRWVERGGDSEGITWSWMLIRDEVKRIEIEGYTP